MIQNEKNTTDVVDVTKTRSQIAWGVAASLLYDIYSVLVCADGWRISSHTFSDKQVSEGDYNKRYPIKLGSLQKPPRMMLLSAALCFHPCSPNVHYACFS